MHQQILAEDNVYHIFNKSIAGFRIFSCPTEFNRVMDMIKYYKCCKEGIPFSLKDAIKQPAESTSLVQIVAFCLMHTHFHFILKEIKKNGISDFMSRIGNGYAKFFNARNNRSGPLWQGRFQRVLVENDEQLLHLTRYVHLNPVTACLVEKPGDWEFSSYNEYLGEERGEKICEFQGLMDIKPQQYKTFVEEYADEQKLLAKIKHLIIEEEKDYKAT